MGLSLNEVMIWWGDPDSGHAMRPQIKALSKRQSNLGNFGYLENSVGACFAGWEVLSDREKAAALFAAFTWATGRDRVPADEAHRAFLEIDAYRQWCETDEGPFGEVFCFAHGDNSPKSFGEWTSIGDAAKLALDGMPLGK